MYAQGEFISPSRLPVLEIKRRRGFFLSVSLFIIALALIIS
jgi:hypothetical protein